MSKKWEHFQAFVAKVFHLSLPYFQSNERWRARGLLAAIVMLNLAAVYMLVQLNDWNRLFYDALQNKDQAVFWRELGRFTYLAFAFILIAVYRFYLTQLLEMRWRTWMTQHYLQRWLAHRVFYTMELERFSRVNAQQAALMVDNPDQRIQEDVQLFTSYSVSLSMGLLNACVTLLSFVGILWSLSGSFAFSWGGVTYSIPGFMVWVAILYCVLGSVLSHYIGRPQIALNFFQQRYEADFRHHLMRVREYSEAIALDRGQAVERQQLEGRFSNVLKNYLQLLKKQKNLVWFTNFFGQAATVFPFIVAAPRFFSGAIQLGQLIQISSAFGRVQDALSWFVDNYSTLAAWRATTNRLTFFEESIATKIQQEQASLRPVVSFEKNATSMQAVNLTVGLPSGQKLLCNVNCQVHAGESVWIQGPSGSGKSTLFRALAGIWPWTTGHASLPADTVFVPQRPYFPEGSLRQALLYPDAASTHSDAELGAALNEALLPHLALRLDEVAAWSQKLSGGEQQRLAIARVFLKKPRWIFADEATSALDEQSEKILYEKMLQQVQASHGALVSIGHRPAMAAFHGKIWRFEKSPSNVDALYTLNMAGKVTQ